MFKRVLRRAAIGLNRNRTSAILIPLVALAIVGYLAFTNVSLQTEVVGCDRAVVLALTGNPGDDQQVVNCFNGNTRGPQTAADVARVRAGMGPAKEFAKVGQFTSDASKRLADPNAKVIASVYVVKDDFPETTYVIYLGPDGNILAIQ